MKKEVRTRGQQWRDRCHAAVARWAGVFVLATAGCAAAADDVVPVTHDLAREAAVARRDNVPVVLVFAQEHCDYCERLDRDVLNPSYATGAFAGRVHIRRVMIDSFQSVRDFDGTMLDQDALRARFKAYVTPTVMLFDPNGKELAPRITGIENAEFYNAYLDIAIDNARERLNARQTDASRALPRDTRIR